MPRPRPITDMQVWMIETGRTDSSLAAELSARVKRPPYKDLRIPAVLNRTVARWRKGLVAPRYPQHVAILAELSGNRVTANHFAQTQPVGPSLEALAERLEFEKLERKEALTALEATEVADVLLEQLASVRGPVAIAAVADLVVSILKTKTDAGTLQQNHFEFQRVFWRRLEFQR